MVNRLSQIIKYRRLTSSQFADEVGVQRSSVSHVLSERNNPSLDFITKVIMRYPEINAEWLLTGRGKMVEEIPEDTSANMQAANVNSSGDMQDDLFGGTEHGKAGGMPGIKAIKKETGKGKSPAGSANIEKIVFFYNDGSFDEYLPRG